MSMQTLRPAGDVDRPALLALNAAVVEHTSPLDAARLNALFAAGAHVDVAVVDAQVAGFVLTFRAGAPYENANFAWFSARYSRFDYVDRIVVDSAYAGRGIGQALYAAVFERARRDATDVVGCEINLVPPNPRSLAFHARLGFVEVGTQSDGEKRV